MRETALFPLQPCGYFPRGQSPRGTLREDRENLVFGARDSGVDQEVTLQTRQKTISRAQERPPGPVFTRAEPLRFPYHTTQYPFIARNDLILWLTGQPFYQGAGTVAKRCRR